MRKGLYLLVFLACFATPAFFSFYGVDATHDGVMLKPAIDIAGGAVPFKETISQYGLFTVLLQAAAVKIFGNYLIALKLLTAFFYGLTGLFLFMLFKRFIPAWVNIIQVLAYILLAPYYFWTFLPWSSVYSLFFQVFVLYLISRGLGLERKGFYFAAGLSAACAFWFRQPVGALLFIAAAFFFLLEGVLAGNIKAGFRRAAWFSAGFFAVIIFVVIFLSGIHALKDVWKQSFVAAFMFGTERGLGIGRVLGSLFPDNVGIFWSALPAACIIVFILAALLYRKFRDSISVSLLLLASCVSIASWAQYFPVNCYRHVYWSGAPMIGVVLCAIYVFFGKAIKTAGIVVCVAIIACVPEFVFRIEGAVKRLGQTYHTIQDNTVLKWMKLNDKDFGIYSAIRQEFQEYKTNGGKELLNFTPEPMYLLYAESDLPSLKGSGYRVFARQLYALEGIYPGFYNEQMRFLDEFRPMIITDRLKLPVGYRISRKLANDYLIMVPK